MRWIELPIERWTGDSLPEFRPCRIRLNRIESYYSHASGGTIITTLNNTDYLTSLSMREVSLIMSGQMVEHIYTGIE